MFKFEYLNKTKMPSPAAFFDLPGPFLSSLPVTFNHAIRIP